MRLCFSHYYQSLIWVEIVATTLEREQYSLSLTYIFCEPQIPLLGICPTEVCMCVHQKTYIGIFIVQLSY